MSIGNNKQGRKKRFQGDKKKFGGKMFTYQTRFDNKYGAQQWANRRRKEGFNVRIVKGKYWISGKVCYFAYARKKGR